MQGEAVDETVDEAVDEAPDEVVDAPTDERHNHDLPDGDQGLGGMKWECVAITLGQVRDFLQTLNRTRDENEKTLRAQIEDHLVPILEKQEESRRRKAQQRERDLLNLARMATAKRSSRIAHRLEHQRAEEEAKEAEHKKQEEEEAAKCAEKKRLKLERERDLRLMSREKRLKEREARRVKHEELAQLSEDSHNTTASNRLLERRLQQEIERNKRALKELGGDDDDWLFDCVCGVHGHIDDGTHSLACEKCNVWQHSKCVGIDEDEAERPEFHFVCGSCRRRALEAERPRTIIKIKAKSTTASPSSSPAQPTGTSKITIPPPKTAVSAVSAGLESQSGGPGSRNIELPDTSRQQPGSGAEKENGPAANGSHPEAAVTGEGSTTTKAPGASPRLLQASPSPGIGGVNGDTTKKGSSMLSNGLAVPSMTGRTPSKVPMPPHAVATPSQEQSCGEGRHVLPPPSVSPTKLSPPVHPTPPLLQGSSGAPTAMARASVLSPEAKLPPRAHEQVLTPPVKNVEPSRLPGGVGSS
jgi:hypothetical protein